MCISWLLASVPQIDLSYNYLTGLDGDEMDGIKAIAEAIRVTASLTSINLFRNHLGPEGAKALALAIRDSPSMTSIDLRDNGFGPEGAKALAPALRDSPSLTYLW
jgi:Ran GTPase-activating protein (RanGAP) involved in mRNA processing and transport